MSSIASFYRMDRADLAGLVRAAAGEPGEPYDYLVENAQDLDDEAEDGDLFPWSGYVMMYLLDYLDESGVGLGANEYSDEAEAINDRYDLTYLITSADKRHLPALASDQIDDAAIAEYFAEMDYALDETGRLAVEDGMRVLREQITVLPDDQIFIVHIG
jgi:hypothetical protein